MEGMLFFVVLFVALELFEASWQKAENLYGVIYNNYLLYKKSFLNYILFNSSFFYVLFLISYLNSNSFLLYAIGGIKFADILFKISTIKKLDDGERMEDIVPVNMQMSFLYRYMNVVIYPATFAYTLM